MPHLLGAALAAVRSQPSETGDWAESQAPRSFSVLQNSSEAVGDTNNSRYVDQQQQQQQSDYYNSSGALSPSIFDQFQPYSSEHQTSEGKRRSQSELNIRSRCYLHMGLNLTISIQHDLSGPEKKEEKVKAHQHFTVGLLCCSTFKIVLKYLFNRTGAFNHHALKALIVLHCTKGNLERLGRHSF